MNQETKTCQNCKQPFVVEPEDFDYYKKINIPPPTFCPDCRRQRRAAWRNERTLYKRKCNAPGHNEDIISVFSSDKPFTVYDDRFWWSDSWDALEYGRNYDFSKPFFTQFRELLEKVPLINLSITNMVNCSYCNVSADDKDSYLISASEANERVMYSNRVGFNKDSMDIYIGDRNELCYDIINCSQCYQVFFSYKSTQCNNSAFLYDCTNCSNCFMCTSLKNKSYYFFNQPYTKEQYEDKLKGVNLGSFSGITKLKEEFSNFLVKAIHRFAFIIKSVNSSGDNILYAKNCHFGFDMLGSPSAEDCKFVSWGGFNCKDSYDVGPGFGAWAEQVYDAFDSGLKSSKLCFTSVVYGSYNIRYSINCHGSNNLFGCYGLRSKEYCILNKQYTKEEYEALVPKIIEHMNVTPYVDKKGRIYKYGEFFPIELSPFAYNETIAQEYFLLNEERTLDSGYFWKDSETKNYQITKQFSDLPDDIKDVGDNILNEVIGCAHAAPQTGGCNEQCVTAFKVTPQELEFYRRMNLPLPRLCYNCRHYTRLKQRNPLKLWHRKCQCAGGASENGVYKNTVAHSHGTNHCPNEFETSYSPERKEIVYCEQCYQNEVV